MRVPLSWLREYVDVPKGATPEEVLEALVRVGFEDALHLPDGSIAQDNSDMVRAAVSIAAIYGMQPASVAHTRARFRI